LSYKSEENKQRIVEAGGIQILVNLLGASSEDVVATAASTLENLCSNSDDYRIRCAQLGAIPCLIELLNSKNEAVQDGSCGALFNLSINTDNRSSFSR
jgi:HEAT repeat protein